MNHFPVSHTGNEGLSGDLSSGNMDLQSVDDFIYNVMSFP